MSYYAPYNQHNFMGLHANDAAALAYIQLRKWDSTKDGLGIPESGMTYFSTTLNAMRLYALGIWTSFVAGAGIPTLAQVLVAGNSAGVTTINMNANKITGVAAGGVAGDALCYGQAGASLFGLDMAAQRITNMAAPSAATDACTKAYADQLIQGLSWQETVLDRGVDVPPGAPVIGDRYIIGAAPVGLWVGHAQDITEWDGAVWVFTPERQGLACWVLDENTAYVWNGAAWVMLSALVLYTLDMVYDAGGAGLGRWITADSGAVDISVPVAVNGTALALHQLMPAATAPVATIENLGASGASLELLGTRRLIQSSAADMTLGLTANDANAYVLHITAANAGAGTAGIGILAEDDVGVESSAGKLTLHGYNVAGTAVEIDSTLAAGGIAIGCNGLTSQVSIGGAGARSIYVGHTGAAALQLVSLQTMLQVTANDALARTLTIAATNAGAGTAVLDIDADDAITIDSATAGFSIDGITASNVSTTTGNLTLDATAAKMYIGTGAGGNTVTMGANTRDVSITGNNSYFTASGASGSLTLQLTTDVAAVSSLVIEANNVNVGGEAQITFSDSYRLDSTYGVAMKWSNTAAEWSLFETNFGEVSLLNAINQCAASAVTLDEAYNAGVATITVDAYDVTWNLTGAFSHVVNVAGCTGVVDGFFVEDGTDYWRLTHAAANTLNLSSELGSATIGTSLTFDLNAAGAVTIDSSGGTISIGADAVAQNMNFGTGAAARLITIGNVTGATGVSVNTGSGDFKVNATQFVVDQDTGRVGIGAAPTYLLDVVGNSEAATIRAKAGFADGNTGFVADRAATNNNALISLITGGVTDWMVGVPAASLGIVTSNFIIANGAGIQIFVINSVDGNVNVVSKLGLGCTPAQRLNIQSGAIRFDYVAAPSGAAVTFADGAAGVNTAGVHSLKFTAVNALGETELGTVSPNYTVDTNEQIIASNCPISADPTVTSRNVYACKAGAPTTWYKIAGLLPDNTTTSCTINVADASLVDGGPSGNTTSARIYLGSLCCFSADAVGGLILGGNGSLVIADAPGYTQICAGPSGAIFFRANNGGSYFGRINQYGIGSLGATPASGETFAMLGTAAGKVTMQRHTTANTAGNSLSLIAGGATSGATDKAGGPLYLKAGTSTGAAGSYTSLWASPVGAAGVADNAPVQILTVGPLTGGAAGTTGVGILNTTPAYPLDVTGDVNIAEGQYYRYGAGILAYAQTALHNYYYGSAGNLTTTGTYNVAVGDNAAIALAALAHGNTAVGASTGYNSSTGTYNVFIGLEAGYGAGGVYTGADENVCVGHQAGYSFIADADYNTLVGSCAGRAYGGDGLTAVGASALLITTGIENTAVGTYAGQTCSTGTSNSFIGYKAGAFFSTGTCNVFVGCESGYGSGGAYTTADYNTCVGYRTGYLFVNDSDYNTLIGANAGYTYAGDELTAVGYQALYSNTGVQNTALGTSAGYYNQTGTGNVFVGYLAGYSGGGAVYTGSNNNVAVGSNAHYDIRNSAVGNVSVGAAAGYFNQTGTNNVFVGTEAGKGSAGYTGADYNVCVGYRAGYVLANDSDYNTLIGASSGVAYAGDNMTSVGYSALSGTTGDANTALGYKAGQNCSTGIGNTFIGNVAGQGNAGAYTGADYNTAVGYAALHEITSDADGNTAVGRSAGRYCSTGTYNVFIGMEAGLGLGGVYIGADYNVCVGYRSGYALSTDANSNVLIGYSAGAGVTTGDDNIFIGRGAGTSNQTRNNLIAIGLSALYNAIGSGNTALGVGAGQRGSTGVYNVFVGYEAGYGSADPYVGADYNVCVGYRAGYDLGGVALSNTLLGAYAGENITTGDGNVCLGFKAGSVLTTENNYLYIANVDAGMGATLLTGNFATESLGIGMTPASITARLHLPAGGSAASTAPLKFTDGNTLATIEQGAVEMYKNTLWFQPYATVIKQSLDGTIFSQTTTVTVASTAAETTLIGAGRGAAGSPVSLPANYFALGGRTLRVTARGFFRSLANSILTLRVKLTDDAAATITVGTEAHVMGARTDLGWSIQADITCYNTGATGDFWGQGFANIGSSAAAADVVQMVNLALVEMDTSDTIDVVVTAQWNNADAGNTITCTNLTVQALD